MNLAELPWNECVLPEHESTKLMVEFSISEDGEAMIIKSEISMLASRLVGDGRNHPWRLYSQGARFDFIEHIFKCSRIADEFIKRESSKPRLPKVNAPDGWRWTFHPVLGLCLVQGETGEKRFNQIPLNKNNRDVLAALVIAYDELNPTKESI